MAGRGAYVHEKRSCWEKAIQRGTLARNLKVELTEEDKANLIRWMDELPKESSIDE